MSASMTWEAGQAWRRQLGGREPAGRFTRRGNGVPGWAAQDGCSKEDGERRRKERLVCLREGVLPAPASKSRKAAPKEPAGWRNPSPKTKTLGKDSSKKF